MKAATFIDLDGTLVKGETQLGMLLHLVRAGLVSRVAAGRLMARYALYVAGFKTDATQLRQDGYALFAGGHVATLRNAAAHYARTCAIPKLRRRADALIQSHAAEGRSCVLVTAASELLAEPLARRLGIECVIATRLETRDGRFTGVVESPSPYAAGKRELVALHCERHGIDPKISHAYTDHESDLPLLELVGHPRAVSPTRRLAAIARARGWPIENLD